MCPALAKQEQVASGIWLVSDLVSTNSVGYYGPSQLDQYFVKGMLLEEVIIEPLIHYYIHQKLPTIQGFYKLIHVCA